MQNAFVRLATADEIAARQDARQKAKSAAKVRRERGRNLINAIKAQGEESWRDGWRGKQVCSFGPKDLICLTDDGELLYQTWLDSYNPVQVWTISNPTQELLDEAKAVSALYPPLSKPHPITETGAA